MINLRPANVWAIYLRKSRADREAEARGEGETLARHRTALLRFADQRGMYVERIYTEIASGESISARPEMQDLLSHIEASHFTGVIVNDADRLARGDGLDQAIIKQAFYTTGALIATPTKTFDPGSESDEDFFDLSMFFARLEYRKINRRLQTGRARSAEEGNVQGGRTSYGYRRVKRTDRSGWTLEPCPEEAEVVRMIFDWYANGLDGKHVGAWTIADRVNALGARTMFGLPFTPDAVRKILRNPNYIGRTTFNKRVQQTAVVNGQRKTVRVVNPRPNSADNAHPAIIEPELWQTVQEMMDGHPRLPKNKCATVSNVLAGLVKCSCCGKTMQRKPGQPGRPDAIYCTTRGCPTTSIGIPIVEEAILEALDQWRVRYSAPPEPDAPARVIDTGRVALEKQLATLNRQMDRLHDLLEQGLYTPQVFVQRRSELATRIDAVQRQMAERDTRPSTEDLIRAELPKITHVLEAYHLTQDLEQRNALLKTVISHVVYTKTKHCYRNDNPADYLTLEIFPLGAK